MLILNKVISQLLLPPGGIILLAAIGVIFWKRVWGRAVVAVAMVLLWLLSTEPVRDLLTSPLEFSYPPLNISELKPDNSVIILLGGGVYENAPEYQGSDELGRYSMMRTVYAAELARAGGQVIYATGGAPLTDDAVPEGSVMRHWLIRFGIPHDRVFAETVADNTWENAAYMKQMLDGKGISKIILVTSAWHMPRAYWCFAEQGFEVVPAPTDYLTEQESYDVRSFLPRWTVLSDSGQALHEYLGRLWYFIRYP